MENFLAISGPTASGKSSLAIQLAKDLSGEILNIDSVQAYKYFNIGSAKITSDEMLVKHYLIDIFEPNSEGNAAEFAKIATESAQQISRANKQMVLVVGTTLYFNAFLYGLSDLPKGDSKLREELENKSSDELYSMLREKEPEIAGRLHPNDRLRVIRALEANILSNQSVLRKQEEHQFKKQKYTGLVIVLCHPREELYKRIDDRSKKMAADGIIEETRQIVAKYGNECVPLSSLGYKETVHFLSGEITEEQMVNDIAQHTRNFAKRQMTFWRNEPAKRGWLTYPKMEEGVVLTTDTKMLPMNKEVKDFRVYDLEYSKLLEKVQDRLNKPFDQIEVWYVHLDRIAGDSPAT